MLDVQLEIIIKASSNEVFTVKIHPGKAKVLDLMDHIQRKLDVPIKDQKLYHGKSLLSDEPRRGLSQELICSFQPTVDVIVPEYILLTVQDVISGDSSIVKIDKEKTLKDLVKEIPSCRNLPENKEAVFLFNGKELCPSRDDETLTNLGIFSGSKLELKVRIIYIEINVAGWPGTLSTLSVSIRCNPQDTFKDLLNKLEAKCNTEKLEETTFVFGERVFDPEQDQSPLQGMSEILSDFQLWTVPTLQSCGFIPRFRSRRSLSGKSPPSRPHVGTKGAHIQGSLCRQCSFTFPLFLRGYYSHI